MHKFEVDLILEYLLFLLENVIARIYAFQSIFLNIAS